jgi:hypothetical protein
MTAPTVTNGTDRAVALPSTVLGVEQEYKWRLEADLFGATAPTLADLERAVPHPAEAPRDGAFRHTQSTLYFDDGWWLTEHRIALRATVNPGAAKDIAWLGVKQTIAWQDGCRDSLEVNERIEPKGIAAELRNRRSLPVTYVLRLFGQAPFGVTPRSHTPDSPSLAPTAFAVVIQNRHKLFFRTRDDMQLQLTFDIAEFRALPDGESVTMHWLEVENNTADLRARHALNLWAHDITQWLGRQPAEYSKSELAAEMAGWRKSG